MSCPDENQLAAFLSGALSATEGAGIRAHVDSCSSCQGVLAEYARMYADSTSGQALPSISASRADTLPSRGFPRTAWDPGLVPGMPVGRYVLQERVGAGGMGLVFRATDPVLKRRVALKVMRPELAAQYRPRLAREAEALARLAHPNVVSVYDLGEWDGRIFVAMEYVDGCTLTEWLATRRPQRRDVLRVLMDAGRGLSAAHLAGLVHRDFKPANVLIGDDGRVRVVDFGLARDAVSSKSPVDRGPPVPSEGSLETVPGAILGTPAYMAPEQHRGEPTDQRSDEYSYCLTLYEALVGERLLQNGADARVREDRRLPPALRRVIARGLASDPAARYPTMAALLSHLERLLSARRRNRLLAGVAAGVLALALPASGYAAYRRQLCRGIDRPIQALWDGPRRQTIRVAFLATKAPYALDAFEAVARSLDDYAASWSAAAADACAATRLRGEQTEALWTRRNACLERRLKEVSALADILSRADADTVQHAPDAVRQLDDVSGCADVPALLAQAAPPDGLEARVAEVHALYLAGRLVDGLPLAQEVSQRAELRGSGLEADALLTLARFRIMKGELAQAESELRSAALAAEAARQDALLTRIWLSLAVLTGNRMGKPAEGEQWAAYAGSVVARLGHPPRLEGTLHHSRGILAAAVGRSEDAIAEYKAALPLLEKALPPEDVEIREVRHNLAWSEKDADHSEDALALFNQTLEMTRKAVGAKHPMYSQTLIGRGQVLEDLKRHVEARRDFETAIAALQAALGPDSLDVAVAVNGLGMVTVEEGRPDEAAGLFRRAHGEFIRQLGPNHPRTLEVIQGSCDLYVEKNEFKRALPLCEQAVQAHRKNPQLPPSYLAQALLDLGTSQLGVGASAKSLVTLEEAARASEAAKDFVMEGQSHFALARARWSRKDPKARAMIQAAQAAFARAGPAAEKPRTQLEEWVRHAPGL